MSYILRKLIILNSTPYTRLIKNVSRNEYSRGMQHGGFFYEILFIIHSEQITDVILLDFSKEFDSVPRQRLIAMLDTLTIDPDIFTSIQYCITSISQHTVIINADLTPPLYNQAFLRAVS